MWQVNHCTEVPDKAKPASILDDWGLGTLVQTSFLLKECMKNLPPPGLLSPSIEQHLVLLVHVLLDGVPLEGGAAVLRALAWHLWTCSGDVP